MDFPVTAEFVATANAAQLHDECRGKSADWPASFVQIDGAWVYRVDDADDDDRDVVVVDDLVKAALASHVPVALLTVEEKVAALPNPTQNLAGFKDGLAELFS